MSCSDCTPNSSIRLSFCHVNVMPLLYRERLYEHCMEPGYVAQYVFISHNLRLAPAVYDVHTRGVIATREPSRLP